MLEKLKDIIVLLAIVGTLVISMIGLFAVDAKGGGCLSNKGAYRNWQYGRQFADSITNRTYSDWTRNSAGQPEYIQNNALQWQRLHEYKSERSRQLNDFYGPSNNYGE